MKLQETAKVGKIYP